MIIITSCIAVVIIAPRSYLSLVLLIRSSLESSFDQVEPPLLSVFCVIHNSLPPANRSLGGFPWGPFSLAFLNSCHTVPVVFQEGGPQSFIEADLNLTQPCWFVHFHPPLGKRYLDTHGKILAAFIAHNLVVWRLAFSFTQNMCLDM